MNRVRTRSNPIPLYQHIWNKIPPMAVFVYLPYFNMMNLFFNYADSTSIWNIIKHLLDIQSVRHSISSILEHLGTNYIKHNFQSDIIDTTVSMVVWCISLEINDRVSKDLSLPTDKGYHLQSRTSITKSKFIDDECKKRNQICKTLHSSSCSPHFKIDWLMEFISFVV